MTAAPHNPIPSSKGLALRLAMGYAVIATLYILVSDQILEILVADPVRLTRIQSYKGWAFVAVTATLLYLIVQRFVQSIAASSNELASALQTQRRLTQELNHRVRNNLAALVAVINLSSRGQPTLAAFADAIAGRVRAMDAAYSLIAEAGWQMASIRSVVSAATEMIESCRELDGPEVAIQHDRIVPFVLVLHELASNAVRHGCGRSSGGRVRISWRVEGDAGTSPRLVLGWNEHGGPPATQPAELGLGLQMAQGMAASDLQGALAIGWNAAGVEYTLTVPTSEVPARGLLRPAAAERVP